MSGTQKITLFDMDISEIMIALEGMIRLNNDLGANDPNGYFTEKADNLQRIYEKFDALPRASYITYSLTPEMAYPTRNKK